MEILITKDYEHVSEAAAEIVVGAIERKADLVLGLATGSTPEGLYARLVEAHRNGLDFSSVTSFNLDEYIGLQYDHPESYHRFMDERLFNHVNIPRENIHIPDGMSDGLSEACASYEKTIADAGGIDVQVLGLGRDGHVGFNEPGTSLGSVTHIAALTRETIEDNSRFFDSEDDVPRFAITMGIQSILQARFCLLMVSGDNKAEAVRAAVEGPITSQVTASALQMHPNTIAILDEAAASGLDRIDFYRWAQDNRHLIADRL